MFKNEFQVSKNNDCSIDVSYLTIICFKKPKGLNKYQNMAAANSLRGLIYFHSTKKYKVKVMTWIDIFQFTHVNMFLHLYKQNHVFDL